MRALVVTSMAPTAGAPARGSFVRDQVRALRALDGVEVDLHEFSPGSPTAYLRAARELRRRHRGQRYDIVHAHFGLAAWPALAVAADRRALTMHGTDLRHPRSRLITRAALGRMDLVAAVSSELAQLVPGARSGRRVAILPCGVATDRFAPRPRAEARRRLGLPPEGPYLLFPADPARGVKRFDRAREVAGDTPLLTLGQAPPEAVPDWVNAANAVLVPSDSEGFGLAALEALACDVPVLATPVGIHPEALDGIAGALCAPFDPGVWRAALCPHLHDADPRVEGRARAERYGAPAMARRVLAAWEELLEAPVHSRSEVPSHGAPTP
jgi:teichuronic acid biosynthesis glycosyltransferase TuaC